MKVLTTLLLLFIGFNNYAQYFEPSEIKTLNSLGLELNLNAIGNENHIQSLETILNKERERQKKKTTGIVMIAIAALSTSAGILVLSGNSEDGQETAIKGTIGGVCIGAGVISGGISIPFFKSAKNKRKERDQLVQKQKL